MASISFYNFYYIYQNYNKNMKKPAFIFYYNNNIHKSVEDFDQIKSVSSNPTDTQTYRSSASSKNNIHRLNEIKPKPKIIVPKTIKSPKQKPVNNYTQSNETQGPIMTKLIIENTNSNEKKNKGLFSWGNFTIICGVNNNKVESSQGCTCSISCPYKQEWIKSHQQSDFQTFCSLKNIKPSAEHLEQIQKDLERTYTNNATYSQNRVFKQMLRTVLVTYSVYDIELGYVQGINNLAAILLYHIKNEELAFWALVELMQNQQLRMIYLGKLQYLQEHCLRIQELIKTHLHHLYIFANDLGIIFKSFLYGWVLSLMSKLVPLNQMHTVLINFKHKGWNYIYRVIITFLRVMKDCLMVSEDQSQFLMSLSEQNCIDLCIDWPYILQRAKDT